MNEFKGIRIPLVKKWIVDAINIKSFKRLFSLKNFHVGHSIKR